MTTENKQIKHNITPRTGKIKYIVIHDTGNKNATANALAHFNYFNSGNKNSSADCFVDSTQAIWINDYTKNYTWHCGDGKGKNGITNNNSIGIELCVNADGDYEKAFENTVVVVSQLMKDLDIPIDRVVRHFDVSGKNCPASMAYNNWEKWNLFKKMLKEKDREVAEYTRINDIVWELSNRGIVADVNGMIEEMSNNPNGRLYWLGRKAVHYIRNRD